MFDWLKNKENCWPIDSNLQWRRQGRNWRGRVPPVTEKTNFEILKNMKRKGVGNESKFKQK